MVISPLPEIASAAFEIRFISVFQMDRRSLDIQQILIRFGPEGDIRMVGLRFSNSGVLKKSETTLFRLTTSDRHTPPGQRQQILDDRCPFFTGLQDVRHVSLERASLGNLLQKQLRIADKDPEDIIEIMGHTARQFPRASIFSARRRRSSSFRRSSSSRLRSVMSRATAILRPGFSPASKGAIP